MFLRKVFSVSIMARYWTTIGLVVLCASILISHTLYVIKTHQYPEQDEHVYMDYAVKFYDILKQPSFTNVQQILQVNRYRQPLYGLFLAIPLLLFGLNNSYKVALWFNGVFYIGTIIAIYLLGREFLSKKASFLASLIFAFYGFPLFYLHFTYSETATTFFVVLSLLFLAKSKGFSIPRNTFLFSLFFTFGNLVRWVVPIFVGGSLFTSFFQSIHALLIRKTRISNFFLNLSILIVFGILPILVIFYFPNLIYFKGYVSGNVENATRWMREIVHPELPDLANVFSVHSIMFYFNILSQQTIFFWILFVLGFVNSLVQIKKYAFFIAAFVLAYTIFTFGSVLKFDRFIVPIYPMMALISAVSFDAIKIKKIEQLLVASSVIIGFLNFLGASWGLGPMGSQGLKDIVLPSFIRHPRRIYLTPIVWPPTKEYANAELFLQTMSALEKDYSAQHTARPNVLITYAYHPFDNAAYSIVVYQRRFPRIGQGSYLRGLEKNDYLGLFKRLKEADFVIVKDSEPIEIYIKQSDETYLMRQFNDALSLSQNAILEAFVAVKKTPIPLDGSNLIIYQRRRKMNTKDWKMMAGVFSQLNPKSVTDIYLAINDL